jgi:chitinase
VDDVRVYDRALSDADVRQLYEGVFVPDRDPPSTPAGLATTVVSSSQIDLAWPTAPDNVGVTGYRIFRDGVEITTVAGTSYSDRGLSPATSYSYEITAFDAAANESAKSSAVVATTPPVTTTASLVDAHKQKTFNDGITNILIDASTCA